MEFIGFLILGLVAGFIASKLINKTGGSLVLDLVLGVVGAFVGGWLFRQFGMPGEGGILYSLLVAVVGAVIVLFIYHAITGRRGAA